MLCVPHYATRRRLLPDRLLISVRPSDDIKRREIVSMNAWRRDDIFHLHKHDS
jgi:hypothetical protein